MFGTFIVILALLVLADGLFNEGRARKWIFSNFK